MSKDALFAKAAIKRARIEMIPLIDVIFLLLVTFIYAFLALRAYSSIEVNLPEAAADGELEKVVDTITITSTGALFFNEAEVTESELLDALALSTSEKRPLVIEGDEQAPLGRGISLLGLLKSAGHGNVSFKVKKQ